LTEYLGFGSLPGGVKLAPLTGLCYSGEDGEGCVERGRGGKRHFGVRS